MSIGVDGGEVLIPTVVNGRVLSDEDAIAHYERTGENFGTFRTPDEATAYAEALHRQHEQQLRPTGSGNFAPGYEAFKGAIVGQETGGRYGVPNAEGSGAMGLGQQMPETARALAQRLGLPWRPELMSGTGPEARAYQDKITDAAVREAWEAGGSGRDPRTSAMYYHGGSNRRIWGPKTRRYADEVLARIGGR